MQHITQIARDGTFVDRVGDLAVFDPQTGRLKLIGHNPCERVPRSFTIDKLGKYLYVAGQGDARLGAYRIEESGVLKKITKYEVGNGPIWIEALSILW